MGKNEEEVRSGAPLLFSATRPVVLENGSGRGSATGGDHVCAPTRLAAGETPRRRRRPVRQWTQRRARVKVRTPQRGHFDSVACGYSSGRRPGRRCHGKRARMPQREQIRVRAVMAPPQPGHRSGAARLAPQWGQQAAERGITRWQPSQEAKGDEQSAVRARQQAVRSSAAKSGRKARPPIQTHQWREGRDGGKAAARRRAVGRGTTTDDTCRPGERSACRCTDQGGIRRRTTCRQGGGRPWSPEDTRP